jgi:coproporphyrinogen III oxidase
MRQIMEEHVLTLQNDIIAALEALDPTSPPFKRDSWKREDHGGYGHTCIFAISDPDSGSKLSVLEKAGVNVSVIHGILPPNAVAQMRVNHASLPAVALDGPGLPFFVAGLSIVIHPRNPHAPTAHANWRYFEVTKSAAVEDASPEVLAWWFGGGSDLTPSYLYKEDAVHFHQTLKNACDPHGQQLYPIFKRWCDEYFHIPHRDEARGLGGIFFDDLCDTTHTRLTSNEERPRTQEEICTFVSDIGRAFVPSYLPILERRKDQPFTDQHRRWQLLRRGRYVEFNLVNDRGTKFGLMTPGARVESILMTLPETARWEYMSELGTEEGSEEAKLMQTLKNPRDWV